MKDFAEQFASSAQGEQSVDKFIPSTEWQDVPTWAAIPPGGEYRVDLNGKSQARWNPPVPGPETVIDTRKLPKSPAPTQGPVAQSTQTSSPPPQTAAAQSTQAVPIVSQPLSYQPKGNSPAVYYRKAIEKNDILIGNGFLERDSAILIVGSSGIGKSSIGMQIGCCWACGASAFDLYATRQLRIVMMQHEDSTNDLIRMSQVLRWCRLDPALVEKNFWIETVRGKIGPEAVALMRELVRWWGADLLILNPLSAYHDGDISRNEDNIQFLYGDIGALLTEFHIGLAALHHDIKPPRGHGKSTLSENYHDAKYAVLGGSVLTNFFRGIITINAIANSSVFRFTVAKRFEESGWPLHSMYYKWHEDRSRRLWVPASMAEADNAKKTSGKTLEDLRKLVPLTGAIAREILENEAAQTGFKRREYRALLAEACTDSIPDALRLYEWTIYNPKGAPKTAYGRFEQPADETAHAVKEARRTRKVQSSPKNQSPPSHGDNCGNN